MRGATRATCVSIAAQRSRSAAASFAPSRARDAASSASALPTSSLRERRELVGRRRVGSASTPGQRRISATVQRRRAGRVPLHVGRGLRDLLDALDGDRERRRAGGGPVERNPAFDLAALQFGRDALAQRGFEPAQLVGQADREVEVAVIDGAQLDRRARRRADPRQLPRSRSC